jgi:arylsulfatase A
MNNVTLTNKWLSTELIKTSLLSSLIISASCHNEGDTSIKSANKPNIVLIMSDDQGWGDFELNGNDIIDTPNLNKIASQGVQFERFYACPMCSPTRASLLTGRYNLRCGTSWVGRRTEMLGLDEVTMADIFKSAGYATGCFGKWHLGLYRPYHPNERGFDEFTGFLEGALNNYYHSDLEHNGKKFISEQYITELLTDRALDFIDANKDQPFFCYIPYNVPHHPFQVPEEYSQKYIDRGVSDERTATVYGMVDEMDWNIGRIMERLKELKLDENTIVVFLSDNGPYFHRFNDGLAGLKQGVDEGSVRVPLYLRWKNHFPENMKIYDIAGVIDILPTLLELTGVEAPANIKMDGISLVPEINGKAGQRDERMIFTHQTRFGSNYMTPGGVRTQQYRLVNKANSYELYDMDTDPSQKRDIALVYPEITEKLKQAYESWYYDVTARGTIPPPVPIGFSGEDTITAVAPDAILRGNVGYNGKYGWAYDFIVNWKSTNDSVIWPVEVYQSGNYRFNLHYSCNETDVGAEMQLSAKDRQIRKTILKAHKRQGSWAKLSLGTMELDTGKYDLILQAINIPGNIAGEFRALEIISE